ncbi:MAG: M3 family metallopeptidase [Bacteroidetes bacterium]|nr:M3 family metallopeptidase [Bacteroidota bacterium]
MNRNKAFSLLLIISAAISACTNQKENKKVNENKYSGSLTQAWQGPYNGVPPFDKVTVDDFIPAMEDALAEKRNEINAVAENSEAANFANTIDALEKCGNKLKRVLAIYYVYTSNMNTPKLDSIKEIIEPRLAAFNDEIFQNTKLFARIDAVNGQDKSKLTPEQLRVLWRYYTTFELAGAKLDAQAKNRVAEINQKLASLFTQFQKHQLADESEKFLEISESADLAGLPDDVQAAAAAAATEKNKTGKWVISNSRSAVEPFLMYSNNRALREKAWKMFINRGDNGDANDNNAIIPEILKLRAERAKLYGYATHAHWRLADKMAKTPEAAMKLLESMWQPAVGRVKQEVADMQELADKNGDKIKIEPWDYRYYAEKVRLAKYDLDGNLVKQYLQVEKLREGMFYVAGELFNLAFTQVTDVPVFHPDVRVYKVSDKTSGDLVGLWYFDPYAREGKRSGAWMTAYREQEKLNGNITTIVSNNCNFIKGEAGKPILISWEDAETLFHEFGHALHGLCSKVNYPLLSGTNTATDYVEFPSQILERWLSTPEVLKTYALHYQTGEPMPEALLTKIKNASKFNQGFTTVEYLASALIDMKLHLAGEATIDADKFERETLTQLGMPAEIVMRHRTPQFGHIFADDGYSAGYYSYLWSDVHSADAYEAFTEAGGPYDKEVCKRLHDYVFSIGGTMDEAEAYKKFRGKEPNVAALMRARGF